MIRPHALPRVIAERAQTVKTLLASGVVHAQRPDKVGRTVLALHRWGPSPATGCIAAAIARPDEPAVIDETGSVSWAELEARARALAGALRAEGIGPGSGIAVLCRNHRGFVEVTLACSLLGATALFMNTMFSGPQLAEVAEREGAEALIYDQEFAGLLEGVGGGVKRFVAWQDEPGALADPTLEELIAAGDGAGLAPPPEPGRYVILTSGTTGAPRGARRKPPEGLSVVAGLLSKIPLRAEGTTVIAAPLFHSWGFSHLAIGLSLRSTFVLRRRFEPEQALRAIAEHGAGALVVVPVMLQRILELPAEARARYDTSVLRVVAASGSALPGELATEWMDAFGDNLYNLYGSTEVAWATIATPAEMRAAPGTAGRPPLGTALRLLDEQGLEVPRGQTGRIFVGNEFVFEGYTGGGGKEEVDGLLATGDVGHLDEAGRLFVDGRDDEMIISGGENVFPREVEDLLAGNPAVREVAVVGVDDAEFGQRLRAVVALQPGAALDEDGVRAYVKANLASFKQPRDVVFVEALPRNATGKVLKRELA